MVYFSRRCRPSIRTSTKPRGRWRGAVVAIVSHHASRIRPVLVLMILIGTIAGLQLFELPYVLFAGSPRRAAD
jgi:hypothetical protein